MVIDRQTDRQYHLFLAPFLPPFLPQSMGQDIRPGTLMMSCVSAIRSVHEVYSSMQVSMLPLGEGEGWTTPPSVQELLLLMTGAQVVCRALFHVSRQ